MRKMKRGAAPEKGRVKKRAALADEEQKEEAEEREEVEEEEEEEEEATSKRKSEEGDEVEEVKRSKSMDILLPVDDPRSTSLFRALKAYYHGMRLEHDSPLRRSGRKALNTQITRCGGEVRFRAKLLRIFPEIKPRLKGDLLLTLPLEELVGVVHQAYPE